MGGERIANPIQRLTPLAAVLTFALQAPAFAESSTDDAVPQTVLEGFAQGLFQPVLGLEHLAAIIGVGILAGLAARGIVPVVAFGVAAIVGVAVHVSPATIPADGFFAGLTTLIIGGFVLRRQMIRPLVASALFAVAGLVHGYSMGESITGAGPAPFMAYVAGMLFIQTAIGTLACAITIGIAPRPASLASLTIAGSLVALAGSVAAAAAVGIVG